MLGALAASSQSARGLFISRSLNPESCVTVFLLYTKTSEKSKLIIKDPLQHM